MRDFGGEIRMRLANGNNMTLRGTLTLGTSGFSIEAITNLDGSVSRQATPKARTAEVSLEDDGTDVNELMHAPRQDIYFTEDFTGVSHVFLNAFFAGDETTDRTTGERTGLTIHASGYRRLG